MKTVTRNAQALQNALDHIQSMQMRIDSMVRCVKMGLFQDKIISFTALHEDLLQLEQTLLKIVPVLTGQ